MSFPINPANLFPSQVPESNRFGYAQNVMAMAVDQTLNAQSFQFPQKLPLADTLGAGETKITKLQIGPMGPFANKLISGSFETLLYDGANVIDDGVCRMFIKISDGGRARTFMNDFVPLNLFLTPGRIRSALATNNLTTAAPANPIFDPIEFEYLFGKNSTIDAQVYNAGNTGMSYSLLFHGFRIVDQA